MNNISKKIGISMNITMCFCLSMIGLISAGKFSLNRFIFNLILSLTISTILRRFIPIDKLTEDIISRMKLKPNTLKHHLVRTFIYGLLFTPLMAFIMSSIAYLNATSHGAKIPYLPMVSRAILISFISCYFLALVAGPFFKSIYKNDLKR